MFRDWRHSLKMNAKITSHIENNNKAMVPHFQDFEFITGLAIMIGTTCYSDQGIPFVLADCDLFLYMIHFSCPVTRFLSLELYRKKCPMLRIHSKVLFLQQCLING
jgi:hypothetical protein